MIPVEMRALALLAILADGCALPDYDYDGDGLTYAQIPFSGEPLIVLTTVKPR